jgi:hypothetical protein
MTNEEFDKYKNAAYKIAIETHKKWYHKSYELEDIKQQAIMEMIYIYDNLYNKEDNIPFVNYLYSSLQHRLHNFVYSNRRQTLDKYKTSKSELKIIDIREVYEMCINNTSNIDNEEEVNSEKLIDKIQLFVNDNNNNYFTNKEINLFNNIVENNSEDSLMVNKLLFRKIRKLFREEFGEI